MGCCEVKNIFDDVRIAEMEAVAKARSPRADKRGCAPCREKMLAKMLAQMQRDSMLAKADDISAAHLQK